MKRTLCTLFVFLLAVGVAAPAADDLAFNGLFPVGHSIRDTRSNLVLVEKPKRVVFQLLDDGGQPDSRVRVIEVNVNSAPEQSVKNPSGIREIEFREPGIYDVLVQPTLESARELRFVLKVVSQGPVGSGTGSVPFLPPSPGPAPFQPASGPLGRGLPPDSAEPPPSISLEQPPATPIAPPPATPVTVPPPPPEPASSALQTAAPVVFPPRQIQDPLGGNAPTDTPAVTPAVPQIAAVPAAAVPAPTLAAGDYSCTLVQPPAGPVVYANPYRPIEIRFDPRIPASAAPEKLVRLFVLDRQGLERELPVQLRQVDDHILRLTPQTWINGAIYHLRALHPITLGRLAEFSLPVLPEIKLATTRQDGNLDLTLSWKEQSDLLPTLEGQVLRLEAAQLEITAQKEKRVSLALTPRLPPVGSLDGITFRGQPFQFTVHVPAEKLPPAATELEIVLLASMAGDGQPAEVLRANLQTTVQGPTMTISATATIPAEPEDVLAHAPAEVETPINEASPAAALPTPAPGVPAGVLASSSTAAPSATPAPVPVATSPVSVLAVPVIPETTSQPAVAATPVAPPLPPLVLKPVTSVADPGPNAVLQEEGFFKVAEGNANDHMVWPKGMTWAPDGTLWLVDCQNARVLRFHETGQLMKAFGEKGKGPGRFGLPIDLALSPEGPFVADTAAHCVHRFNADGEHLGDFGVWGQKTGQMDLPHGLASDKGQIWLVDRGNGKVMRFSPEGVYRGSFGRQGELPGYLHEPIAIQLHQDRVVILEKSGRVQWFTREGRYLSGFSTSAREASAMDVDPWGYVWIADGEGRQVLRFNEAGKLLIPYQYPGNPSWNPTCVTVRSDGLVAIADAQSKSILLFRLKGS